MTTKDNDFAHKGSNQYRRLFTVEQRFWSKVNKNGPTILDTPCWEWEARRSKAGYGQLWVESGPESAHRVSYKLSVGLIPEGINVLHRCDNKKCVNPDHLFLGTRQDNMDDMSKKGRKAVFVGGKNPVSKLTEKQVREIRTLYATGCYSYTMIAQKFTVSPSLIGLVVRKVNWKHV